MRLRRSTRMKRRSKSERTNEERERRKEATVAYSIHIHLVLPVGFLESLPIIRSQSVSFHLISSSLTCLLTSFFNTPATTTTQSTFSPFNPFTIFSPAPSVPTSIPSITFTPLGKKPCLGGERVVAKMVVGLVEEEREESTLTRASPRPREAPMMRAERKEEREQSGSEQEEGREEKG